MEMLIIPCSRTASANDHRLTRWTVAPAMRSSVQLLRVSSRITPTQPMRSRLVPASEPTTILDSRPHTMTEATESFTEPGNTPSRVELATLMPSPTPRTQICSPTRTTVSSRHHPSLSLAWVTSLQRTRKPTSAGWTRSMTSPKGPVRARSALKLRASFSSSVQMLRPPRLEPERR